MELSFDFIMVWNCYGIKFIKLMSCLLEIFFHSFKRVPFKSFLDEIWWFRFFSIRWSHTFSIIFVFGDCETAFNCFRTLYKIHDRVLVTLDRYLTSLWNCCSEPLFLRFNTDYFLKHLRCILYPMKRKLCGYLLCLQGQIE